VFFFFFFQAEDGIRDLIVTGVQTCALPISVSWTPATRATNVSRLIMAHMIWLAEMFSDPYVSGHETTRLHSDGECRCRRWYPGQIGRASCRERVSLWVVGVVGSRKHKGCGR